MGLALLPPEEVRGQFKRILEAINALHDTQMRQRIRAFHLDYILGFWIKRIGPRRFSVFGLHHKSNNCCEVEIIFVVTFCVLGGWGGIVCFIGTRSQKACNITFIYWTIREINFNLYIFQWCAKQRNTFNTHFSSCSCHVFIIFWHIRNIYSATTPFAKFITTYQ